MKNLIRAGIHRVVRRKSRIISLAVVLAAAALLMLLMFDEMSIFQITDVVNQYFAMILVPIGLLEFGIILGDDMRAKSLQIAIGSGSKRRDIVAAEWVQIVLFTLVDFLILFLLLIVCCVLRNVVLVAEPVRDIALKFVFIWIRIGFASMFCMGLALWTQSTTVSTMLFLAYCAGVIKAIFEILLKDLGSYLPTSLEGVVRSRLAVGIFSLPHVLGMVIYLILFYVASCAIFQKKELEF